VHTHEELVDELPRERALKIDLKLERKIEIAHANITPAQRNDCTIQVRGALELP
jgi:hypothetical protein